MENAESERNDMAAQLRKKSEVQHRFSQYLRCYDDALIDAQALLLYAIEAAVVLGCFDVRQQLHRELRAEFNTMVASISNNGEVVNWPAWRAQLPKQDLLDLYYDWMDSFDFTAGKPGQGTLDIRASYKAFAAGDPGTAREVLVNLFQRLCDEENYRLADMYLSDLVVERCGGEAAGAVCQVTDGCQDRLPSRRSFLIRVGDYDARMHWASKQPAAPATGILQRSASFVREIDTRRLDEELRSSVKEMVQALREEVLRLSRVEASAVRLLRESVGHSCSDMGEPLATFEEEMSRRGYR